MLEEGLRTPFCGILGLFSACFGPPTGPIKTFSTGSLLLGNLVNSVGCVLCEWKGMPRLPSVAR